MSLVLAQTTKQRYMKFQELQRWATNCFMKNKKADAEQTAA